MGPGTFSQCHLAIMLCIVIASSAIRPVSAGFFGFPGGKPQLRNEPKLEKAAVQAKTTSPAPTMELLNNHKLALGESLSAIPRVRSIPAEALVTMRGGGDGTVKTLLSFRINYKTRFGENLVLVGNLPDFGEVDDVTVTNCALAAGQGKGARMAYISDDNWGLDIALELEPDAQPPPLVSYRYVIVDDKKQQAPRAEGGSREGRLLNLAGASSVYPEKIVVKDTWRHNQASIMLTKAFTDVIFKDPTRATAKIVRQNAAEDSVIVKLTIENPRVEKEHSMAVIGSVPALGSWEDGKVTVMQGTNYPTWELDIVVAKSQFPLEYRYVIVDNNKKVLAMEQGDQTRKFELDKSLADELAGVKMEGTSSNNTDANKAIMIVQNDELSVARYPLFKSQWRGAGIAVPVFGLRSSQGMGVGEFLDLKPMADWCAKTKLKILQLLPVTDTTTFHDERDSYPYSSISVFALHPLYLRISAIPGISGALKSEADKETKRLNDENYYKENGRERQWDDDLQTELFKPVDYPEVMKVKRSLLAQAYDEVGEATLNSKEFKEFFDKSERWLRPYGVFCWLRDFFGTANHEDWGALGTGKVSKEKLMQLSSPKSELYKGVAFYWCVQYWLHLQLLEASKYCEQKGVALKGDLPIGIDHDSVDAWFEPHLFNMNKKTGAPPDDYAQDGQNWGFPTYNWDMMRQDGFGWWRARLGAMQNYFHAYRIDHILGFFRIWEMPSTATGGLLGKFQPSIPIYKQELANEGIFDVDRLCEPYIRKHLMERLFGHDWARVKDRFFDDVGYDAFKFKSGLWSEVALRDIVMNEGSCVGYLDQKKLISALNQLVNNVVLLRDDEEPHNKFYPRIEMWKTTSFQELPGHIQHKLRSIYENFFWGKQDLFWADQAMMKLPQIMDASKMLVCGEDLGMIPDCVAGVLEKLVIMGLKIQRMPPPSAGSKFGICDRYPYMSVCTPSCHDMSTVAGWWEEDPGRRQEFWNHYLQRPGEAPQKCTTEVAEMIVKQHLWSPSCWAIFPIQDLYAMESSLANPNARADQINWPPNPTHYWRWRSKTTIEELLKRDDFSDKIKSLVVQCGRDGGY